MNHQIKFVIFIALFFLLIVPGCGNNAEISQKEPLETQAYLSKKDPTGNEPGYPPPEIKSNVTEAYPIDQSLTIEHKQGPDFKISGPVNGGDKVVRGAGPANVPIILVNVSTGGTLLGKTTIQQDGSFTFNLEKPVESGNSIGIQLGDISGTAFNQEEFIYNDNYYDRPIVGILFDMIKVK